MRTYCIARELSALWCPKWEGNPQKRRYMYVYGWLIHFCYTAGTDTSL